MPQIKGTSGGASSSRPTASARSIPVADEAFMVAALERWDVGGPGPSRAAPGARAARPRVRAAAGDRRPPGRPGRPVPDVPVVSRSVGASRGTTSSRTRISTTARTARRRSCRRASSSPASTDTSTTSRTSAGSTRAAASRQDARPRADVDRADGVAQRHRHHVLVRRRANDGGRVRPLRAARRDVLPGPTAVEDVRSARRATRCRGRCSAARRRSGSRTRAPRSRSRRGRSPRRARSTAIGRPCATFRSRPSARSSRR